MMGSKMHTLPVALALLLSASTALAQSGSWLCDDQMDMDRYEARALSHNNAMFNVVNEYRERWDAQYMRAQCEAFAEGRAYDISCLNDRRDWAAIEAMIPRELFGMSNPQITPHFHALQMGDDGVRSAVQYCRSVGAIR